MTSNNGQGGNRGIPVAMYKRQERMEILGVRVGDLRSSEMRKDQL